MRRFSSISVLALLLSMLVGPLGSGVATASVMVALDIAELTRRADEVVVADVLDMQAEPAAGGRIVTRVLVRVSRAVVGGAGRDDELEVILPGGELGSVGLRVHGAPRLAPGGRYLLFLTRRAPSYRVVGMAQGAYPVLRSTAGAVVTPPPDLPGLVRPEAGRLAPASPAIARPRPLADVLEEVRRGAR